MKIWNSLFALSLALSSGFAAAVTNNSAEKPSTYLADAVVMAKLDQAALSARLAPFGVTARNGITIYRLAYHTTSLDDSKIRASGIMIVPDTNAPVYPWISLQHGTISATSEAPSRSPLEGLVEGSQGFVAVVPDYLGFGESEGIPHPYIVAEGYEKSIVDMLRAARELASDKKIPLGPFFLKGYSEGGYATLALQKYLEEEHAEEFPIVASSPAAGPYDVELTGRLSVEQSTVNPVNIPFVVLSYNYWLADGTLPLTDIFKFDVDAVESALSGRYTTDEIFGILPQATNALFEEAFVTDFLSDKPQLDGSSQLRNLLVEQSLLEGWTPKTPTRFYHCQDDQEIPVVVTTKTVAHFQAQGAPVSSVIIPSPNPERPYTHGNCPAVFSPIQWFGEILLGAASAG